MNMYSTSFLYGIFFFLGFFHYNLTSLSGEHDLRGSYAETESDYYNDDEGLHDDHDPLAPHAPYQENQHEPFTNQSLLQGNVQEQAQEALLGQHLNEAVPAGQNIQRQNFAAGARFRDNVNKVKHAMKMARPILDKAWKVPVGVFYGCCTACRAMKTGWHYGKMAAGYLKDKARAARFFCRRCCTRQTIAQLYEKEDMIVPCQLSAGENILIESWEGRIFSVPAYVKNYSGRIKSLAEQRSNQQRPIELNKKSCTANLLTLIFLVMEKMYTLERQGRGNNQRSAADNMLESGSFWNRGGAEPFSSFGNARGVDFKKLKEDITTFAHKLIEQLKSNHDLIALMRLIEYLRLEFQGANETATNNARKILKNALQDAIAFEFTKRLHPINDFLPFLNRELKSAECSAIGDVLKKKVADTMVARLSVV